MKSRTRKDSNKKGYGSAGKKPHSTVWGRLLICQCGKRFNQHFHNRADREKGVDYQCYTSVNRGSPTERAKRGLSNDEACESPFIPGWKLEMMAKFIFDNYIEDVAQTMELSYAMLEQHIADKEEIPDNSDVIKRKQSELEKLYRKRANLIEMREDGDIDREYFKERKDELEKQIAVLLQEIERLTPKAPEQFTEDFGKTLKKLRKKLEGYVRCDEAKIPEGVVEAFIEKIWVSKDEFRWYLRSGSKDEREDSERVKIAEFTINLDQAKAYQYGFSTRKRIYNWVDLNVSIWI